MRAGRYASGRAAWKQDRNEGRGHQVGGHVTLRSPCRALQGNIKTILLYQELASWHCQVTLLIAVCGNGRRMRADGHLASATDLHHDRVHVVANLMSEAG